MLTAEFPDAEERLAALPRHGKVARLEASAARRGGRAVRGEGPLAAFVARLREWQTAAADQLTKQDQARSERLCLDCASENVATTLPSLTSGRICAHCAREATT
jgi:hypothetical protein